MNKNPWDVYDDVEKLGMGRTGPCHVIQKKSNGRRYAGKIVYKHKVLKKSRSATSKKAALDAQQLQRMLVELRREISLLRALDSPYVVKIIESYENEKFLFLVEELCTGGSLLARIPEGTGFTEAQAAKTFFEMVSAVSHCHENNIAHRDLKLEHFMFLTEAADSPIILIDFGLSHRFGKNNLRRMNTFVSTVFYTAPEILAKLKPKLRKQMKKWGLSGSSYSEKVDNWSLGVLLYMLLSGHAPFQVDHSTGDNADSTSGEVTIEDKIVAYCLGKATLPFQKDFRADISEDAKKLILGLLQANPRTRLSLQQTLESPWLSANYSVQKPELTQSTVSHLQTFSELTKLEVAVVEAVSLDLSSDQLRQLRGEFEKIDTDHNGVLSLEELRVAIGNTSLAKCGELDAEALFRNISADEDGEGIRFRKFVAAAMRSSEYFSEEHLKAAFERLDRDDSGDVQLAELNSILGHLFSEEEVEQALAELRQNGGDNMDYKAFLEIIKRIQDKVVLISPKNASKPEPASENTAEKLPQSTPEPAPSGDAGSPSATTDDSSALSSPRSRAAWEREHSSQHSARAVSPKAQEEGTSAGVHSHVTYLSEDKSEHK